ncbi:hypothetical protein [Sediminibacterium ginsengisoli]|uniref:Transglutaminase-like superfamily protein n=1 Tax=Sediminibacterium ginsengisoli TaxID=413434 RepID=A0A1T4MNH5_9BACT|nr:hypothetical protein [Sediminibacterium ginsengisoli]SJZ68493.1 hypothetical protein SAMN04488132_103479 [Sediminibacterium ginsengisoli]
MLPKYAYAILLVIGCWTSKASYSQEIATRYKSALDSLHVLIENNGSFKNAVIFTETAYSGDTSIRGRINAEVSFLAELARRWSDANPIKQYKFGDSINFQKNYAVYSVLKDTVKVKTSKGNGYLSLPYKYDFNDFTADKDWKNMFVSKLLATHRGNCHSLPYLYKILADELGATCWLSLAPNHIYIKNRSKNFGWYNTELTSGSFPIDAWVMASGYVPIEAVQNGIYMDTLSNQQAIALCVLDLAKGYERTTKNYYDGFIVECCDLVLKYHPKNVMAILLKAETMKKLYLKEQTEKYPRITYTPRQMAKLYGELFDLGYREMPEEMYMKWLQSVQKEKAKYNNQKVMK